MKLGYIRYVLLIQVKHFISVLFVCIARCFCSQVRLMHKTFRAVEFASLSFSFNIWQMWEVLTLLTANS